MRNLVGMAAIANAMQCEVRGADKLELTRLFPSGGQTGTVVDVDATGKFPVWPVQVWSDTDTIRWSFAEGSGKLKATIDANAKPGIHWMRLHHPSGASAVRPFLVSNATEQIEVEPNNRLAEANVIATFPKVVHGVLHKKGEVDLFSLMLSAGQRIVATVDAEQMLRSPLDASLQVLDANGFLLEESLDHFGLDPSLEFIAPRDGKYVMRVFGFPATPDQTIAFGGGEAWLYRLRIQSEAEPFAVASQPLGYKRYPLAVGQATTRETSLMLELPAWIVGAIEERGQRRFFRFQSIAGLHYRMQLIARERGSEMDATLAILDSQGKQLVQQDDVGNDRDPDLKWKAPADGEHFIEIQDFHKSGGKNFDFEMVVSLLMPDFKLSIPNELIQTTVGKETEVEVSITRECDFAGDITVSLEGTTEGVECPAVISMHGKDTAKKVKLTIKSSFPFQGPVRITARAADMADTVRLATTESDKPLWISITAEK